MLSNLPPGVTDSMLPGNRPEDQEWEDFWTWLEDKVLESDLQPEEKEIFFEGGMYAVKIYRKGFQDGFKRRIEREQAASMFYKAYEQWRNEK